MSIILYSSKYSNTKKIASYVHKKTKIPYININTAGKSLFTANDNILICTPTYGCEELQDEMEEFILTHMHDINKNFYIIESGIPYGYERFHFGAKHVIEKYILQNKLGCVLSCVSINTYPKIDYNTLDEWLNYITNTLND